MAIAPSFSDLVAVGKAELQSRRPDLLVAEGDVTQAFLHAGAAMNDAVIRYAAQAFKNTFIDGAAGAALTTLADDHFNIQRQEATASEVTILLSRAASATGGTILAGTVVATDFDANGEAIEFTTDTNLVFASGALGPSSVTATATTTGRATNVAAAAITRVIDQPSFDPNWLVTNTLAAAGGNDEETDPELRERVRSYFKSLRRGTIASLETGALEVASVRVAVATEDPTTLICTLYIADSDGNSTPQMIADVETEIVNWKAAGTTLNVSGAGQVVVDLEITIADYRSDFDVTANASLIEAAIAGRIDRLKPGQTLYLGTIGAAAIAAFPDDIYDITITSILRDSVSQSTSSDLTATPTEVLRAGTVTVT
jgi:uncharacterized phage protein gp47/JayE